MLRSLFFPITAPAGGPAGPRQGNQLDIMTFHIDQAGGGGEIPAAPPPPRLVDPELAARTRVFTLGAAGGQHMINGGMLEWQQPAAAGRRFFRLALP